MPPPTDPEIRAAILRDIKAGLASCRSIAATHGVAPSTVAKIAKAEGIEHPFERAQTQKATAARQIDLRDRFAKAAARNLAVHEAVLASYETMTARDWASVSPHTRGIILGITADKARDLAPADDGGLSEDLGLLGALVEHLQAKHGDGP